MSRRETTVNVLLGVLLVSALAAPLVLGYFAFRLAIYLLDLFTARFFPGFVVHVVHRDIAFAAILAGFLLIEMIQALRWRRWREAFLKFAVVSGFGIVATSNQFFGNSADIVLFLLPAFFFGSMPGKWTVRKDLNRPQFVLGVTALSVLFAVEAGLLGSGFFRQLVSGSTYIAFLVWCVIRARKGWEKQNDEPELNSATAV